MQPKILKIKSLIFLKMKDNLNLFEKGRQPQKKYCNPKQLKVKTIVVAPLPVT
jgi:hypothetical protein